MIHPAKYVIECDVDYCDREDSTFASDRPEAVRKFRDGGWLLGTLAGDLCPTHRGVVVSTEETKSA